MDREEELYMDSQNADAADMLEEARHDREEELLEEEAHKAAEETAGKTEETSSADM